MRERLRSVWQRLVSLSQRVGALAVRATGSLSTMTVSARSLGGRLRVRFDAWRSRRRARREAGRGSFYYRSRPQRYRGSRGRRYTVHVPLGYTGRSAVPLVMVLHGCHQTHHEIQHVAGFDAVAERAGFLTVYPFVTGYAGWRGRNCWGWWHDSEIHAGAGEVEDLWHIVREVQTHYNVDRRRIHVTGLSAGAAMAVALMVTRAHRIASGATVAGLPYGESATAVGFGQPSTASFKPVARTVAVMDREMGANKRLVPLFIVHSQDDQTLNIQAAHQLRDSWAMCFGIDLEQQSKRREGVTRGTRWEHVHYSGEDRRAALETLLLQGPGHGWYGGNPGRYSYPDAPQVSDLIWQFFKAHPLELTMKDTQTFEISDARPTT